MAAHRMTFQEHKSRHDAVVAWLALHDGTLGQCAEALGLSVKQVQSSKYFYRVRAQRRMSCSDALDIERERASHKTCARCKRDIDGDQSWHYEYGRPVHESRAGCNLARQRAREERKLT